MRVIKMCCFAALIAAAGVFAGSVGIRADELSEIFDQLEKNAKTPEEKLAAARNFVTKLDIVPGTRGSLAYRKGIRELSDRIVRLALASEKPEALDVLDEFFTALFDKKTEAEDALLVEQIEYCEKMLRWSCFRSEKTAPVGAVAAAYERLVAYLAGEGRFVDADKAARDFRAFVVRNSRDIENSRDTLKAIDERRKVLSDAAKREKDAQKDIEAAKDHANAEANLRAGRYFFEMDNILKALPYLRNGGKDAAEYLKIAEALRPLLEKDPEAKPDDVLEAAKGYVELAKKDPKFGKKGMTDVNLMYLAKAIGLFETVEGMISDKTAKDVAYAKLVREVLEKNLADAGGVKTVGAIEVAAKAGKTRTVDLGGGAKIELVWIPPGGFMMGAPDNEPDSRPEEKPQHPVKITKGFYMGKYEVTVGEFRAFVKATGYKTEAERGNGAYVYHDDKWQKKDDASWTKPYFDQTDRHPVVCVSWNDCKEFTKWLNEKYSQPGMVFRLPTEAEWEYACRAGTKTAFSFGGMLTPELANINKKKRTVPVGSFPANAFGLHDMHGNVWEWCEDTFSDGFYRESPKDDPMKTGDGAHVLRGGSWSTGAHHCRSARRSVRGASALISDLGLRLVLSAPMPDRK